MYCKAGFPPNATHATYATQGTKRRNATNPAEATLLAIKPYKSLLKYKIIEIKFDLQNK